MSNDTSATSPEPDGTREGDSDQLSANDTLLDRGVADLLDEGYSPPERDRSNHHGETAWEELHGEGLDRRLAAEEPDTDAPRDERRAGRLAEDPDAADGRQNDLYAEDAGIDGAGASAEEASMHVVDEI
ncbi:hypothetical protein CLV28_0449 [Sediminihabitans luteus]|uniref:DUF5709 domain-containing protein n=1 Tax=Sediminihabitans luteus TaxID=1138585 RepID=A0A2M9CZH3_9CELL|nr:DUF5709 domain-containing protein [Sediminihabitans luteus]PJJ77235.1 hypothetical protein CLV28_0449 [Sediminihabitans luteus]GII98683.1 hypothetical protein Slu03_10610 [Sediminihabitans luteus]